MIALVLAVAAGVCLAVGWLWEQAVPVYAALGASTAGLVLLLWQVWSRRRKSAKDEPDEGLVDDPDLERRDEETEELDDDGETVFVLPGRKRFHKPGCRLLDGKAGEELTIAEAEEESFTPCSVCAPLESDQLVAR